MVFTQKNYLFHILCLLLILGNITAQIFLRQNAFDNEVANSYHKSGGGDAYDYVSRAELVVQHSDFVGAFKNGYRLPGYPLFLSIFYNFSDQPRLAARYAQVILSALIILFSYLAMSILFFSEAKAILGALVISCWIPFYYLSPMLYAESCSIFLFALIIFMLSKQVHKKSIITIYTLPILLALLVYLKPNHVLLLVPILIFLFVVKTQIRHLFAIVFLFVLMLAPWSIFISTINRTIIPISTTAGVNLYLGTGVNTDPSTYPFYNGALSSILTKLKLKDEAIVQEVVEDVQFMSVAEQNTYYSKIAKKIWRLRPIKTTLYGFIKILHCFGFSFRGFRGDIIQVMLFGSSFLFSIYLWFAQKETEWCIFFWAILFVSSLQAFIFLPIQRLKTIMFDLPAIMINIMGIFQLYEHFVSKARNRFIEG